MFFHNLWGGHLSEFLVAFNQLTIMIFFSLPMVGQVFCFCHQWWVTSSDFLFFTPNGGGSLQMTFLFATNGGVHFNWFSFLPPMGDHFKSHFFFTTNWGVISSDIFFHRQWGVTSSVFFRSPMGGRFKWFFHLPRYFFTFLVHKIWIFSLFNC